MIIFRADGNGKIGSGHVMRCLSLADAALERNISCCFVTAGAEFADIIQSRGHRCFVLETNYTDMEGELPTFTKILSRQKPKNIVVDSYFVSKNYFAALRPLGKLAYVDGFATLAYPIDVFINYGLGVKRAEYEKIWEGQRLPEMLLGPRYAPLRREFQHLNLRPSTQTVRNVLVSTGGADPEHVAIQLVHYLRGGRGQQYTFHFLLGAMNTDGKRLKRLASDMPHVVLHENVRNVRELMCSCDVALSAAGSTLYELCACGLPIVTYILADNQIVGAETFASQGLALLAGDARAEKNFSGALLDKLDTLARDYELRAAMAKRACQVVDGKGAGRIITALVGE